MISCMCGGQWNARRVICIAREATTPDWWRRRVGGERNESVLVLAYHSRGLLRLCVCAVIIMSLQYYMGMHPCLPFSMFIRDYRIM